MEYYHHTEIGEGKLIRLIRKGTFEGWAELISTDDPGMTLRDQKSNALLLKQRWLVRWLDINEVPTGLPPGERITQITLRGGKTHRVIYYLSDRKEDTYNVDTGTYRKYTEFNMDDDFDGVF